MPSNKEFQDAATDNLIASNNDTTILAIKNHNSGNDITYKKAIYLFLCQRYIHKKLIYINVRSLVITSLSHRVQHIDLSRPHLLQHPNRI